MGISPDMLKRAVDSMGASMLIFEPQYNARGTIVDFTICYMNEAARTVVKSPQDYAGVSFVQLTGLKKNSSLFSLFARTVAEGKSESRVMRINMAGGGITDALYSIACTPSDAGLVVTWHKETSQERSSQYTANELFETWEDSFAVFELVTRADGTEDLRILAANRAFAALIAHDHDTLAGKLFSETCAAAMTWLPYYIETAKTGVGSVHESYNYILKKYVNAVQFSPSIGQVALMVLDRTHFWKTQQTLDHLKENVARLFASMPSGFCVGQLVRDEQGAVIDAMLEMVNPAYEVMEGFPTATLQGEYLSEAYQGTPYLAQYTQVVEEQGRITFTKNIPGTGATVETVCFSHGDDVFICVENDVTARVKAEVELAASQTELAEKHRIIMASIDYASKIQRHLLPQDEDFRRAFRDYAVIWDPRDIVGGDIYWLKNFERGSVLCVCDCTGHGTPGAFLTMLVVSAFETIVHEQSCQDTASIIWQLEQRLVDVLNVQVDGGDQDVPLCSAKLEDIKDGCDLAVLSIANDGSVVFSSGNTHVFVCDGHEVTQLRGQKVFVGEGKLKSSADLRAVTLPANPNHKFYIASDGLFDQMGQTVQRPFGYQTFKRIILENHEQVLDVILQKLWDSFEKHRGSELRRDDVQLIAFQK